MDAVDLRIVRLLTWKPFDPADQARGILTPADVARVLEVHPSTVKRRIQRMRDECILQGIHVVTYPPLIGIEMAVYRFRWADALAKERGARLIAADPAAADGLTFVGDEAWFAVSARTQSEADAEARRLAKETDARHVDLVERRLLECTLPRLRDLDRRILSAYHEDWLRPMVDVAEEVGVTAKTVRARLDALARAHAFLIIPNFASERLAQGIPFALVAETDGSGPTAALALLNAFPDALQRGFTSARLPHVLVTARTGAAMDAMVRRALELPGVERAWHLVVDGSIPCRGVPEHLVSYAEPLTS